MPVVTLTTNAPKDADFDAKFSPAFSALAAECLSKPPQYLMTIVNSGACMTMAGTADPCACIKICSIGSVTPEMNKNTCTKLTEMVCQEYKIDKSRVFIDMYDVDKSMIGLGGEMFDVIFG